MCFKCFITISFREYSREFSHFWIITFLILSKVKLFDCILFHFLIFYFTESIWCELRKLIVCPYKAKIFKVIYYLNSNDLKKLSWIVIFWRVFKTFFKYHQWVAISFQTIKKALCSIVIKIKGFLLTFWNLTSPNLT